MTASTEVNTCTRRRSPGFFVETLSGSGLGVTLGEGCKWIHLPEATGTLTRVMTTTTSSICTDTIEPKISEGGREGRVRDLFAEKQTNKNGSCTVLIMSNSATSYSRHSLYEKTFRKNRLLHFYSLKHEK